jgi:hypothetical protein
MDNSFFLHWKRVKDKQLHPCQELTAWEFYKSKVLDHSELRKWLQEQGFKEFEVITHQFPSLTAGIVAWERRNDVS